jgi:hypothetical protein
MKNIILLSFLFLVNIGFAQNHKNHQLVGNISGLLNSAISDVVITLYNSNKLYQTKTDSNGNYCFKNIENGVYTLIYKNEFIFSKYNNFSIDSSSTEIITNNIVMRQSCASYFHSLKSVPGRLIHSNYSIKPNQNINAIAAYVRGVDSRNGETPSIKGARPENTAYYIDGVRVNYFTGELIIGKQ